LLVLNTGWAIQHGPPAVLARLDGPNAEYYSGFPDHSGLQDYHIGV